MTLEELRRRINVVAPNLMLDCEGLTMHLAIKVICERIGMPMPPHYFPIDTATEKIWRHIEETKFTEFDEELPPLERELTRTEALSVFIGQAKAMKEQKQYLIAVLTRQMDTLAGRRVEEAVLQINEDERAAIGWSSW